MIPAIILAAGRSSRMGRPKALLPLDHGETFLSAIVRTMRAGGADDVMVVVGHDANDIVQAFAQSDLAARFVVNADYDRGQLSSLLTGLAAVDRPAVRAVLMTLIDVPRVAPATVRAVLDRYRASGAPIVRPVNGERHGHPLLIDRSLFDALRSADARSGAKPIVRAYASAAGDVVVDDEGAFVDVDTPDDYARLTSRPAFEDPTGR